jgi:signal transduction histidine kinase
VGFDPEATRSAGLTNGLPGMQERLMLLGGRLEIESAPGGGTHLLAELPLAARSGEEAR